MADLAAPDRAWPMIRETSWETGKGGRWHFLKPGRGQTTMCGYVLDERRMERAPLAAVREREICGSCWPWAKVVKRADAA